MCGHGGEGGPGVHAKKRKPNHVMVEPLSILFILWVGDRERTVAVGVGVVNDSKTHLGNYGPAPWEMFRLQIRNI